MYVSLEQGKMKIFPFDWKLAWKYFEKYLKQKAGMRETKDASERRYHTMAFVKRTLNKHKIKTITKDDVGEIERILKQEAGENPFYQKAGELFIQFLRFILS